MLQPRKQKEKGGPGLAAAADAPVTAVAISCCGNFGLVGNAAGRVDRYNMQSGLHRGTYHRYPGAVTFCQCHVHETYENSVVVPSPTLHSMICAVLRVISAASSYSDYVVAGRAGGLRMTGPWWAWQRKRATSCW